MGCDIHVHVETMLIPTFDANWTHLCNFHFERNYLLFALMAGVRRYDYLPNAKSLEEALEKRGVITLNDPLLSEDEIAMIIQEASDTGITCGQPSFNAKGIPSDISWRTVQDYTLCVTHDDNEDGCTKTQAASWVAAGTCKVWNSINGEIVMITNPDWHTPSWLNIQEMKIVAERMRIILTDNFARTNAGKPNQNMLNSMFDNTLANVEGLIAMLEKIEESGCIKTRVVFWFDS
jgi:hypothetical protein